MIRNSLVKNHSSKYWILITAGFTLALVGFWYLNDILISSTTIKDVVYGSIAAFICLLAIFNFVMSVIAVFQIKSWIAKIVPVICILATILVFGFSLLVFMLSSAWPWTDPTSGGWL